MQTGIPGDGQGLACVDWAADRRHIAGCLTLAYTDWIEHLIASPDKQIELADAAAVNLMCFIGEAAKETCR